MYGVCYDVKFTVCLLTVQCASCICMERYANVLYFVGGVIYYVSVMYRICVTVTNTRLNALHNQK